MTDETAGSSYTHYGDGPQFINSPVGRDVNIWQHVREIVAAHAFDEESVDHLLEVYAWTTQAMHAAEVLRSRHSVVLTAPPGSGRRSTALAIISGLGATPHRIDLYPDDAGRDLPAETGCGYVLDIDEKTSTEIPAIGEILSNYANRLATAGAYLVVTATDSAWRPLKTLTSFEPITVPPPSAGEIFRKHLERTHPADAARWAGQPDISRILSGASPADAVRLADLAGDVLTAGSDEPVRDTIAAYNNWSVHLSDWFRTNHDGYIRALLIAAAALGEARTETVFAAADYLADLVRLAREPGGGLAGDGVTNLIATIQAKEIDGGRLCLPRPAYPESVLDLVWQDRPHLRRALRQWLTELPGKFDDAATENAGFSLIKLAIRHGDHGLIRHAVDFWAKNGQARLATVALTEAALSSGTGRAARQQMYDWATRAATDKRLQLAMANVCGGPFGKNYPRNAMTRLRHLARNGDAEVQSLVAAAITELVTEPHLRVFALREVIRWATEGSGLGDTGMRSFLSVADVLPGQLKEPPGPEERHLLIDGWRSALRDPDHLELVRQGGKAWLESAVQNQELREALLTILADACQSSRDIGTLCAIAMQWSRDETHLAPVSRYEVASDFLQLIADRDPLTPGLSPTWTHLSKEENG